MAEGSAVSALLSRPREWTVDGLHATLDALEAETGDDIDHRCFEIVDGTLLVSPPAAPRHELVTSRLIVAVSRLAPLGWEIVPTVGIDLDCSYLVPDLLVIPSARFADDRRRLLPSEPLLVVEIVSPGSATMDRVTKPALYAAAGIAHYWRVETRPDVTITAYALDDHTYREAGTWGPGETMTVAEPFPVTISLDELNRSRPAS